MDFPDRRWLRHETPWFVENEDFFITICCRPRGTNQLCRDGPSKMVLEAVACRHENFTWFVWGCVLMPDHLHAVVSMGTRTSLKDSVKDFKKWVKHRVGIDWQKGFFDHRIRNNAYLNAYCRYMERNPVRAGLVEKPQEWPYYYEGKNRTSRRLVPTQPGTSSFKPR